METLPDNIFTAAGALGVLAILVWRFLEHLKVVEERHTTHLKAVEDRHAEHMVDVEARHEKRVEAMQARHLEEIRTMWKVHKEERQAAKEQYLAALNGVVEKFDGHLNRLFAGQDAVKTQVATIDKKVEDIGGWIYEMQKQGRLAQ
ncbi:MAG: hypothetical protein R3F33_11040 [Planctomycetota bacterium]